MGVKSLWQLLDPVGRPVLLETMEGKSMAIDSSIWIYQFQATMRDKEGRGLVNAHVVGFLRRICKLLFYGIRPVFVFDGGAPALKMSTIAERKNKKHGAAASHAKVAERLLAAHMRREALEHAVGKTPDGKGKGRAPPARIDENTVYLEDLTAPGPIHKTPAKQPSSEAVQPTPPSSSKKSRWRDHDPYKLPEVNMDEVVARVTATAAPDPRLATEDELRTFIEEMRPEDFDVTSPAFRELPTEVQYEIIGDLRLKSRQTSYKRLQSMLRNAKTPLDFSKEQIKNLKQRNSLTQQLLVTTDSIGKAHITIPIRIASERNKQYVLVKNEGAEGGWVLGIRDEGTAMKPIEIDPTPAAVENDEDEDDDDMEDVPIAPIAQEPYDADLREYRREQAISALAARYTPNKLTPLTTRVARKRNSRPLFEPEDDELPQLPDDQDDPELVSAIQESIELEEEASLHRAMEESRRLASTQPSIPKNGESSGSAFDARPSPDRRRSQQFHMVSDESDDEDLYTSPTRLETALSIGGAGPRRTPASKSHSSTPFPSSIVFGTPSLLLPQSLVSSPSKQPIEVPSDSEADMEEIPVAPSPQPERSSADMQPDVSPAASPVTSTTPPPVRTPSQELPPPIAPVTVFSDSDEDMEDVEVTQAPLSQPPPNRLSTDAALAKKTAHFAIDTEARVDRPLQPTPRHLPPPAAVTRSDSASVPPSSTVVASGSGSSGVSAPSSSTEVSHSVEVESSSDSEAEPGETRWSRSPSPTAGPSTGENRAEESWDAAQEIDPNAEEDEYTRFLSHVKGKDIDAIRREIDDEVRELNKQKKNAMRDSEDITQQMISQIMIMLRLFGIPYITAPMEAEAQCATLLSLGLVDGIITDDSDVFLFGGARVLKNMFNQSKTVECFLLPDLERELGLDRDKLVRLAYLLGSDYTEGLPGVGPVVAMELLSEFPGHDGLHKFKAWWMKVQSGRDKPEESGTRFRKRFKKKFKELYLAGDWPNPAVRDAYYHPTVDESTEPFKWGMPDLDALRDYFNTELGWDQKKVDDLLLPIIRKMSKRSQNASANAQGNLAGFFDIPLGANAAPRKRQAYTSKRLQQVVSDFRKQQAKLRNSATPSADDGELGEESDFEPDAEAARPAKKRKKTGEGKSKTKGKTKSDGAGAAGEVASTARGGSGRGRGGGRGRGRGRGGKRTSKKRERSPSDGDDDEFVGAEHEPTAAVDVPAPSREELGLRPRPKPRPVRKPPPNAAEAEEEQVYQDDI
ncbi:PIN domain-like protein [Lentinus tigrinus ALCF2SS1-7]|uniref:PIN domain-like protein n=1 Tax=Lentinus tigrinus ALCF2SS1-6 TaxID=1328759 RepID=A0A5C2S8Q9_9APHY|nr:PIN domain-like protein [Lentinus tigrinus ALCF2SS1-6]RPD74833.1 PIN domain-like protein [Lentinus tigrinus ALCF2SS1-7]